MSVKNHKYYKWGKSLGFDFRYTKAKNWLAQQDKYQEDIDLTSNEWESYGLLDISESLGLVAKEGEDEFMGLVKVLSSPITPKPLALVVDHDYGGSYTIMEKIEGSLFMDYYAKTESVLERLGTLLKLCEGYTRLVATTEVSHTDLHDENVIVTPEGEVRIIDWEDYACREDHESRQDMMGDVKSTLREFLRNWIRNDDLEYIDTYQRKLFTPYLGSRYLT